VRKQSQYELDVFLETFPTWGKALKAAKLEKLPPVFGSAKQFLVQMADDFDEPLQDFAEYM